MLSARWHEWFPAAQFDTQPRRTGSRKLRTTGAPLKNGAWRPPSSLTIEAAYFRFEPGVRAYGARLEAKFDPRSISSRLMSLRSSIPCSHHKILNFRPAVIEEHFKRLVQVDFWSLWYLSTDFNFHQLDDTVLKTGARYDRRWRRHVWSAAGTVY